jgi:hypothetical protein
MRTEKQCSFGVTIKMPTGEAYRAITRTFAEAPGGHVIENNGSALISFHHPSGNGQKFGFLMRVKDERELSFAWPQAVPPLSTEDCFVFRDLIVSDMLLALGAEPTAMTWTADPYLLDPRLSISLKQVLSAALVVAVAFGVALLIKRNR